MKDYNNSTAVPPWTSTPTGWMAPRYSPSSGKKSVPTLEFRLYDCNCIYHDLLNAVAQR